MLALAASIVAPLSFSPAGYPQYGETVTGCVEMESRYPASAPSATLRAELESLMIECSIPGWDGYGADPVSMDAYRSAERFVRSLPWAIPQPELAADPDGCVTFEWRKTSRRTLLVSVGPSYALDYAALIGTARTYGSEPFFGELPEILKALIRRVVAA